MWLLWRLNCLVFIFLLTACASTPPDRPGVQEAKACMKALRENPRVLPGYVIEACTNNGVWVVIAEDETGIQKAQFDFVNGEYAGVETMGILTPVMELDPDLAENFASLRQSLNKELLEEKL